MPVTLINTLVQDTGYLLDDAGDQMLVTTAGSLIEDNSLNCVQINNSGNHAVTVDGLFYDVDNGVGVAAALNGGTTSFYVNGQVVGDLGIEVSEEIDSTTANFISVGSQGSIVGLATNAVLFSGNSAATDDRLDNAGNISANLTAVSVTGDGGDLITNSGKIGGSVGVGFSSDLAMETVVNSGTMTGGSSTASAAIESVGSSVGIDITNSGLLTDGAANTAGGSSALLYFDDNSRTTSTIDNTGSISGSGYVIQSVSDILDISNSGTVHGGLYSTAAVDVDNSGVWKDQAGSAVVFQLNGSGFNSVTNAAGGVIDGAISIKHSRDTFWNAGTIDGAVTLPGGGDTFTNAGTIDGEVWFSSNGTGNSMTNSGEITGNVVLSAPSGSVTNHGKIYGNIILGTSDTLINTGTIHGNVTLGSSDTFDVSPGIVTGFIQASTVTGSPGDLFEFGGDFGKVTFDDFVAGTGTNHDSIQFAANDFGTFSQVQSASSQVGADVVIKLDASDSITLNKATLSSLVSADFKFV
jgi:hypothetical protein